MEIVIIDAGRNKKIRVQPLTLLIMISSTVIIIIKAIINLKDTLISWYLDRFAKTVFRNVLAPPTQKKSYMIL